VSTPGNPFTLAHWRRSVAEHYADVRKLADTEPAAAATRFRAARDQLFREHAESPIAPERRAAWPGIAWHRYDPAWRVTARVYPHTPRDTFDIELTTDGTLHCVRVGRLQFAVAGRDAALNVYWLAGYGGGLWLPFADASSGSTTYGGGRYLYDTIKGADLGGTGDAFVLDFNFAYNPSCAYDERWSCPLSPLENRLPFAVDAGERMPR